ncbi:MAG: hypothetical protein JWN86_904 [Planctomycetota bacterium]|nr:hypothetical protein [Planctomycetota bacterium]
MSLASEYFKLHQDGAATVVRVTADVIRHPQQAQEFSSDLAALVERDGLTRIAVNLRHTHYLGSSAFAALFGLAKRLDAVGGQLALCDLQPEVLTGAKILGLGSFAPIHATEKEALTALSGGNG